MITTLLRNPVISHFNGFTSALFRRLRHYASRLTAAYSYAYCYFYAICQVKTPAILYIFSFNFFTKCYSNHDLSNISEYFSYYVQCFRMAFSRYKTSIACCSTVELFCDCLYSFIIQLWDSSHITRKLTYTTGHKNECPSLNAAREISLVRLWLAMKEKNLPMWMRFISQFLNSNMHFPLFFWCYGYA